MKNSRPVYSTASGRLCPECGRAVDHCVCTTGSKSASAAASSITIWRERKGRGGKEVSIIRDLPLNSMELQLLASALKKHCGSGGTVTNGCIEIQGNQRESIKRYLEQQGYRTKLAGS